MISKLKLLAVGSFLMGATYASGSDLLNLDASQNRVFKLKVDSVETELTQFGSGPAINVFATVRFTNKSCAPKSSEVMVASNFDRNNNTIDFDLMVTPKQCPAIFAPVTMKIKVASELTHPLDDNYSVVRVNGVLGHNN